MVMPASILASDHGSMTDQGFYCATEYKLNDGGRRLQNEWLEWFWFCDLNTESILPFSRFQ